MRKNLILTLTGRDRVGIVEQVTKTVLQQGGNVEASKMARMGGEFAMLMHISVPDQQFDTLQQGILSLRDDGFTVTACSTEHSDPDRYRGWIPYQIEVHGADHEGIIHTITHRLAQHNINVETMDTGTITAPMSGTLLFTMQATVLVPPNLPYRTLEDDLEKLGYELNVDIDVAPYAK